MRTPLIRKLPDRVALWVLIPVLIGTLLRVSRLGDYDNSYYTAAVASMLSSSHNFLFASFDPAGIVMVDKPPAALWLQAASSAIFGVSRWSVTLPQVLMGIASIAVLYWLISSVYGRLSGAVAATVLAVLPAAVVIDSRNEPDALVAFAALLAAVSLVKAIQTGGYRWYLIFGVLMAIGFNAKMLVAFVPLPAFLLYSVIAAKQPLPAVFRRLVSAVIVLTILSFSWVTFIGLTPEEDRPFVGSTQDNSIWTLVFEYNGLNRFTSFIGARRPQIPVSPAPQQGQPLPGPGNVISPNPPSGPSNPPIVLPEIEDSGIFGLSQNRLGSQLGWLLPLGLISLIASIRLVISDDIYRRPSGILEAVRTNPRAAHAVLWVGWLVIGLLIFGSANATTTHPYYLVGVAIPLAAVIGLAVPTVKTAFEKGTRLSWIVALCLVGCALYQVLGARDYVPAWCIGILAMSILLSSTLMITGLWKGLQTTPLASFAVGMISASLLIVPVVTAVNSGGQIVGPGPNRPLGPPLPGVQPNPQPIPPNQPAAPPPNGLRFEPDRDLLLKEFIAREEKTNGNITLLTVNARQAAPFILEGVRSVAIGGFSGNDPIFSVQSFRDMASDERPSYFLMPDDRRSGPGGGRQQDLIIAEVLGNWEDYSTTAGLPPQTLFRKPEN